ncbi:MAG: OadG family transporter subunit [Acutalibacteraceae bacterium]|jgi:sodium pump decarboxylase gamma subunit|nr:OadG family transporter subunit [Oscillospiraceae bacterium]
MPGEISIAQVVLMGLITVFVGLICLIIIIKLMGTIIALLKQQSASPEKAEAAPAAIPAATPAPAAPAANNQQIVAAIAVAIAEEMGTDVSHIRIHSIRRI